MYAFRRDEPRIKPIAPMQKVKLVIAAVILFHSSLHAQVSQEIIAGLRAAYMQETHDSAKMHLSGQLANGYRFSKLDDAHIVGLTLNRIGHVYMELEDYRNFVNNFTARNSEPADECLRLDYHPE